MFDATTDRRWAVKCYLSAHPDRAARYREISFTLAALDHPALVRVDHHPTGMSLAGQTTEVVTMPWVVGDDLLTWVAANLDAPARIGALAGQFAETVALLEQANVAHGDLHHGNMLITPDGRLMFVDYDAMYVPTLAGLGPAESGHANYYRSNHDAVWGPHRDRYTCWTIYASLLALSIDPDLFRQVPRAGEERLLLGADDHRALAESPVLALLGSSADAALRDIGRRLGGLGATDPSAVPALDPRRLPPVPDRSGSAAALGGERAAQRARVLEDHARELALVTAEEEPHLAAIRARRRELLDRPDATDSVLSEASIAAGLARRLDRSVLDGLAEVGITMSADVTWSGDMVDGPTRVKGPGHRGRGVELSAADRRVIGLWKEGLKPSQRRLSEDDAARLLATLAEEETQLLLATQAARVRLEAKRTVALSELRAEVAP